MTAPTTTLMTADEFHQWVTRPENAGRHFELERGRIVEMSRPGERHGFVAGNIARLLGNYTFARRRGYVCGNDTGVLWERDPDTVRGPDVMYYAERRRSRDLSPRYSDQVPLLVVEVVSPNDRPSKVTARAGKFLDWGVKVVWVVDPEDSTLTVYRANQTPTVLQPDEEVKDEETLPDFHCRVGDFFATPGDDEEAP